MSPYQKRTVKEKKELDEKLDKLEAFINGATFELVSKQEQLLLKRQKGDMQNYSATLGKRISFFK